MPTEADTRIVIDRLLREAGWEIENKSFVSTEEPSVDGRADYLLKNQRTQPLAVVEAKRFSIDPYSAKQQTKAYAVSLLAPFILLSNGREHYFWDYENGDARPVLGFPTQGDLERRANLRLHRHGDIATSLRSIPYPSRFRFKGEEVARDLISSVAYKRRTTPLLQAAAVCSSRWQRVPAKRSRLRCS